MRDERQFVRDERQFVRDERQFVRDERQFVRDERQFARDERQFVRGYGVSRERRTLGPPYECIGTMQVFCLIKRGCPLFRGNKCTVGMQKQAFGNAKASSKWR